MENKLCYKILRRIFILFEYWFKKFVDYHWKKWSVYTVLLKYVTFALIAELPELFAVDYLDPFYNYISIHMGNLWGIVSEVVCRIILGDYISGFSYISIGIKLYLITFFGILEYKKGSNSNWNWSLLFFWKWDWNLLFIWNWNWSAFFSFKTEFNLIKVQNYYNTDIWKPTKKWFEDVHKTQVSDLLKNKYNADLHEESDVEKMICRKISKVPDDFSEILREIDTINEYCQLISNEINKLDFIDKDKESLISLNKTSKVYAEILKAKESVNTIKGVIGSFRSIVNSKINYKQLSKFKLPKELVLTIGIHNLNQVINEDRFDLLIHKKEQNNKEIYKSTRKRNVFNAALPLVKAIYKLNEAIKNLIELKDDYCLNNYVVHSIAGYGKTHLSLNLVHKLKEVNIIFFRASSFSGNFVSIFHGIKKILELPQSIAQSKFLEEINNYCIKKKTKLVFLIDGLNETTNHVNGFSSIWAEHLQSFIDELNKYSHLSFIATCRSSYLDHIGNISKKYLYKLEGFEDEKIRKKVVSKYFEYYKLRVDDFENTKLDFFEIPLVLGIFCMYKNPLREYEKLSN